VENAVVVARTVLEDVDMDVVGVRFVGAWAEHGREPAATRLADRIDCRTGITWCPSGLMVSIAPFPRALSVFLSGSHPVRQAVVNGLCRAIPGDTVKRPFGGQPPLALLSRLVPRGGSGG
jgi:hypothetical protein